MTSKAPQIDIAADYREALESIEQQLIQSSGSTQDLVAVTVTCEPRHLLHWLSGVELTPRVYWRGREDQLEIAGCGAAVVVRADDAKYFDDAFATIDRYLKFLPESVTARFLGGICYDPARAGDQEWLAFPSLWFVLPQITFMREDDRYRLTLALDRKTDPNADKLREQLATIIGQTNPTQEHRAHSTAVTGSCCDLPRRDEWLDLVARAQQQIAEKSLEKVVLARRTDLELTQQLDPLLLVESLRSANAVGYSFLLQPDASSAFLGAPPERLFKVNGRSLESEAIAGTRPLGESEWETEELAAALWQSDKDSAEHQFVVDAITATLQPLCEQLESGSRPEIMRLGTLQHLRLPLHGQLRSGVSAAQVLQAMHPTPAVGGTPREAALTFIRANEPFTRGWYAAPVGYLGRDSAEFAVAIRSLLIRANQISLFAGAGIVAASDPQREWQELEQKIVAPLRVLGDPE
jgi:menaquinone-specific isochorismate synthase